MSSPRSIFSQHAPSATQDDSTVIATAGTSPIVRIPSSNMITNEIDTPGGTHHSLKVKLPLGDADVTVTTGNTIISVHQRSSSSSSLTEALLPHERKSTLGIDPTPHQDDCSCNKCTKILAYSAFSVTSALTSAINAGLAGYILYALAKNEPHAFSMSDLIDKGFEGAAQFANILAFTFFGSSLLVNIPLSFDMFRDLINKLNNLTQFLWSLLTCDVKYNLKTAVNVYAFLASLGSAAVAAFISVDAFRELEKKDYTEYLVTTISTVLLSALVTLAGRYVGSRIYIDETAAFYTREDFNIVRLLTLLETSSTELASFKLNKSLLQPLVEEKNTSTITQHVKQIFALYNMPTPDDTILEKIIVRGYPKLIKLFIDKQANKDHTFFELLHKCYSFTCGIVGWATFALKFEAFLKPKQTLEFHETSDVLKFAAGIAAGTILSATTGMLYKIAADQIFNLLKKHWKNHPIETIGITVINFVASPSMFTVAYKVAKTYEFPPGLAIAFGVLCAIGALNVNSRSCFNILESIRANQKKTELFKKLDIFMQEEYREFITAQKQIRALKVRIVDQHKPSAPISQAHHNILVASKQTLFQPLSSDHSITAPAPKIKTSWWRGWCGRRGE